MAVDILGPNEVAQFPGKRWFGPEPRYPHVLSYPKPHIPKPIMIAGPCSIESDVQVHQVARTLKKEGVTYMRGGVWRAGTYPPSDNFGMQIGKPLLQRP